MYRLWRIFTWLPRWVPKEKPWLWRPGFKVQHRWQWYLSPGIIAALAALAAGAPLLAVVLLILLPIPYIGWSDDGLYDFDDFGLAWFLGPWVYKASVNDND